MQPETPLREKLHKSICVELGEQASKAGLAITTVVFLILINANLSQLVYCLTKYAIPTPAPTPESNPHTCNTLVVNPDLKIALEHCRNPISFKLFIENHVQVVFNETSTRELITWVKQCAAHTCKFSSYNTRKPQCPFISFLYDKHYVCFDEKYHVQYMVLDTMKLIPSDSLSVFYFLAYSDVQ